MRFSKGKSHSVLANLAIATAKEAALLIILLVILPRLGVNIHFWIVIILATALAGWSYFTYRIEQKNNRKIPIVGLEALIGAKCRTATPLSPTGYVQASNELWRACSISGEIKTEVEVVIVEIQGLTLLVKPSSEIDMENADVSCSPGSRSRYLGNPEICH